MLLSRTRKVFEVHALTSVLYQENMLVAIPFCETITTITVRATVVLLLCPLRQAYSQPNESRTADCNKRDGPIIA